MSPEDKKRAVAEAALRFVQPDAVIGVGTGSTANHFIACLARIRRDIEGTVASSEASAARLKSLGIPVLDLNAVGEPAVYVDGADEATRYRSLIKGGGGALTREKIVAAASRTFVCIVDDSKLVDVLGRFPVAVEVLPMARSYAAREIAKLGGQPLLREGFTTDNGNIILDVHNLSLLDPARVELELNQIAGVVANGIFSRRPADVLLVANASGVDEIR